MCGGITIITDTEDKEEEILANKRPVIAQKGNKKDLVLRQLNLLIDESSPSLKTLRENHLPSMDTEKLSLIKKRRLKKLDEEI